MTRAAEIWTLDPFKMNTYSKLTLTTLQFFIVNAAKYVVKRSKN